MTEPAMAGPAMTGAPVTDLPVTGLPEITAGSDLAALIAGAVLFGHQVGQAAHHRDGDV